VRTIFHIDLDAFFCAVEELLSPALKDKAFMVGGKPNERGVVASASYAARKFGVRNAMPTAQAMRLCPGLIVVSHHRGDYSAFSRQVMSLLHEYGDAFQPISIDEAFLDLTELVKGITPLALAAEIQTRIRDEIHLPASIGVATSKLVAKMASGMAKPNGIKVIAPGDEAAFLAPMAVNELWGVGAATAARLSAIGIRTIGQIARAQPNQLRRIFGNQTDEVIAHANGIDDSPVQPDREIKSVSEERTFARDVSDPEILRKMLLALSDAVAMRLRANDLAARTVHLKLRWHDFNTITRQNTLPAPTQLGDEIFAAVEALWQSVWHKGDKVRLLGVGASGFEDNAQMSLFDDNKREQKRALANTLDELRKHYGDTIVRRASLGKK
jgi:DNA polymerase-4